MLLNIDFSQIQEVIKRIKNPALLKKLQAILQMIQEQVNFCNQHYAQTQNSTDTQVMGSLAKIQQHLDALSKLAEFGDSAASLIPAPTEKQAIHLIQQILQHNLPNELPYSFDWLVAIRDKNSIALSPVRELRFQAARRIFKQFLLKDLQPFIQSLGEPKKIFMSYAWATLGHPSYHRDKVYEGQVEKIANDLERAGCKVFLDHWYDQAGKPLTEFLELMGQADCFIPIGTELYLHKYNKRAENESSREHVVRAEGQILNYIATYSSDWRSKIKPVLLEGTPEATLPFLIAPNISLELYKSNYFEAFFRLIKSIYGIDNRDADFTQLETTFYQRIQPLEQQDDESLQITIQDHQEPKAQRPSQKRQLWASSLSLSHKLWHVPAPNLHFTGRTELLKTLHENLSHSSSNMIAITALKGLGGIGKTHLAIKYVYEHHRAYKNIFWISAESEEQLLADYRALAEKLNLPIENKTPQEVAAQLKDWLEHKNHTGWLMVYDNVNDPQLVKTYKPKHGGTILITSRRNDWVGIPHLEISVFSLIEARDYIQKITGYSIETYQEDMDKLAEQLGYLPLALAQACAYIAKNHTTLQDYLNLYKENRQERHADKTMPLDAEHESVAVTWQITFKAIREQHPAGLPLLVSCAYLHADNIPEFLLKTLFNQQQPDNANQLKPFLEAIGCLQQYSMLKLIAQTGEKAFSIHSLVQNVIFDSLSTEKKLHYLLENIEVLQTLYPYGKDKQQLENYAQQQRCLLPHLEKSLSRTDEWLTELKKNKLFTDLQAKLLENIEKKLLLKLLIFIADGYDPANLGDALKQKILLKRVLNIEKKYYGSDHPEVIHTLMDLGNAYGELGNALKQKTLMEYVLTIQEKHYGPEHLEAVQTLNILSTAYLDLGDSLQSKGLLERALIILEKHYELDNQMLATTLINLGNTYCHLGNPLQGKRLLKRALIIKEKHYGHDHLEVARILGNLGTVYQALGNAVTQKMLMERALSIFEKHYGPEHPMVAKALVNLGNAYCTLGNALQSKKLLEIALIIKEKHYGSDHSEVAHTLRNLSKSYFLLGNILKVKTLLERALTIQEKHYGPVHGEVAMTLTNLAVAYKQESKLKKAMELIQRAYRIFFSHPGWGPQHPNTQHAKALLTEFASLSTANSDASAQLKPTLQSEATVDLGKQLRNAANQADAELLTQLLRENKNLNVNAQDNGKHQRSALHWAVIKAAIPCIKALLQAGVDIYLQDKAGKSAVDYAGELPDPMVLSLLLSHRYKLSLEGEIDMGKLLRRAAHEGDADMIEKILGKWPNKINEKDQGKTERTALHWAVIKGHEDCVKVLLAAGADPSICDKENFLAIALAKKLNHVAIHQILESSSLTNAVQSPASFNEASNFSEETQIDAEQAELQQAIACSLLDINPTTSLTASSSQSTPATFFRASTPEENEWQKQIQANYAELQARAQLVDQTEEEVIFDNEELVLDLSFSDDEYLSAEDLSEVSNINDENTLVDGTSQPCPKPF